MSLTAATIAKRLIPIDESLRDAYNAVAAEIGEDSALAIEIRKLVADGRGAKNMAKGGADITQALNCLCRIETIFGRIAVQADGLSRSSRRQLEIASNQIRDLREDLRRPPIQRRRSA